MTDEKELRALIARAEAKGATVTVTRDAQGHINTIQVAGVAGIGPHPMGPIGAAEAMRSKFGLAKLRSLWCSCCGAETMGRQWYNRDTGFGLCKPCVSFVEERTGAAEMRSNYGERGVHYDLEAV